MKHLYILSLYTLILFGSCVSKGETVSQKSIEAAKLQSLIAKNQPIALRNMTIHGDLYFSKSGQLIATGKSNQQVNITAPIYFENCRFSGHVASFMQSADSAHSCHFSLPVIFQECVFEKTVDLRDAVFQRKVSFSKSQFKGNVWLQGTHFHDDFQIDQTIFDSSLFLQEVVIRGVCYAKEAQIKNQFSMQQADLWQEAFFAGLTVYGHADFGQMFFRKSAFFEYSKFYSSVNYSEAVFQCRAEWSKVQFSKTADMSNAWFYTKPIFLNIEKKEPLDFTNTRFDNGEPEANISPKQNTLPTT